MEIRSESSCGGDSDSLDSLASDSSFDPDKERKFARKRINSRNNRRRSKKTIEKSNARRPKETIEKSNEA